MDTTQKNRERSRQQDGQQERRRSAGAQHKAEPARKKRAPEQPAKAAKRPQRPAARQSAPQQAPERRVRTTVQREEGVRYSAPQGTGPRKSAPQMSPQQKMEARKKAAQRRNGPNPNQKRTLKDNPLQKFMAGIKPDEEKKAKRAEQAQKRQEKRAAEAERKKKQAQRNNTPAVIYTQPEVFNRNTFLVRLVTVLAVVAAMIVGMSVFFKVETITVAGAETYSAWTIREAAGISEGDGLLTFSRAKANAQIQAKLPYVKKSRIGIKLPNTVIIYIEEAEVTYAIKSIDGIWYLMTSAGRVVEQIDSGTAASHTQITGVTIQTPVIGESAVAMEEGVSQTDPTEGTGETEAYVPVAITGALRLNAVLDILKALEANDIVGEAASVDVSRLEDIVLWYGTRYQVELGDTSRMEYKIACMNDVILEMSEFDSGILDVSFDIMEDRVIYKPFS